MGLEDSLQVMLLQSEATESPYEVDDKCPKAAQFEKPPQDYETVKPSEENPYVADPMQRMGTVLKIT